MLSLRFLLAAVFLVAAVGKLLDRPGSRRAFVEFGVPERLSWPLAVALPAAELTVALALLPQATARWGALGALGLLLAFTGAIAYNLARGRRPDCHCFGQLYSAPAGRGTLVRNGALAALAAFLVWQGWDDPGPGPLDWAAGLSGGELLALIVGLGGLIAGGAVGWFTLQLARSHGRLQLTVDELKAQLGQPVVGGGRRSAIAAGLPIGRVAPDFELEDLDGRSVGLPALLGPRPVLLAFVDPDCRPCRALLPDLKRWQEEGELSIVPVSRGSRSANLQELGSQALTGVLLQRDGEVAGAYEIKATPSAVLIGRDGRIASSVAAGPDAISELVARASRDGRAAPSEGVSVASDGAPAHSHPQTGPRAELVLGAVAPAFELPDLDGRIVHLADYRGKETMILFWNPSCGFCARIAPEVTRWAERSAAGRAALVLVALGGKEANAASGLGATILLDPSMEAFGAFGATGTPVAVKIDRRGRVASRLALGVDQVRDLALNAGLAAAS